MHLTGIRHCALRRIEKHRTRQTRDPHAGERIKSGISGLRWTLVAALLPLALLAAACGDDGGPDATATPADPATAGADPTATVAEREVERVTFMAGFKPQANLPFVGAYVAQEKGFFAEQDLEVDIKHAQSGEHLQLLLAGTVDFATANGAQVVQRNSEGLPITSIALVGQKSEQGFIVGADSGIETVQDWAGKTFGYKGSVPVEFLAITEANQLEPDAVEQVRVGFDPRVLSEGQVDILAVFISNEPGQLDRIGYPTRLFDPSEYGIPALGLTYIATRQMVEEKPDVTRRFVKAVLRGIEYADANREEALDIVMKYAPQEDRDQQQFMLETELARAQTPAGFGSQTREQWQALSDALIQYGIIESAPDISSVFSDDLTAGLLSEGKVQWP